MDNKNTPQIYFHVGLGKTASTYLQYKVFPNFKNIDFIHRKPKYKKAVEIIAKGEFDRYLISREFDQQLEREVKKFAAHYPDTCPIIVFRSHASWIASQYRRFVKNGYAIPFTKFFDLENDNGMFKQIDLNYMHKIQVLEKYFSQKPLVLFYNDLRNDPFAFFDKIAKSIGAEYDKSEISLDKKHSSYNEKQLKTIMKVSKRIDIQKRNLKRQYLYHFRRVFINIIRYTTLFIGKYIPKNWVSEKPLISKDELEAVDKFYASDWDALKAYAKN